MLVDLQYMYRCLQLAQKGRGSVSPNPMVGAVVVHENKIIGEGYHRKYGEAHAEVNAINSVKDKHLLKESTLYVSLEPCSHYGKTPPCAQLIIDSEIPRVVIGSLDPFPQVAGRGVKMLKDAGVETKIGILQAECDELNKEFITVHTQNRPYVYLKWAQSEDGFMDRKRSSSTEMPTAISNDFTKILVHQLRANVDAIMIGTNTAILDNPSLITRCWYGKNPIRIVIDRSGKINAESKIFDGEVLTYIVTETDHFVKNAELIKLKFDDVFLNKLLITLKEKGIMSLMIEGGAQFLQYIIDQKMWDEAFVERSNLKLTDGIKAPDIKGVLIEECSWKSSKKFHFRATHA